MKKYLTIVSALLLQTLLGNAQIVPTELNYNPSEEYAEFIELKNIGTSSYNLSSATFSDGIVYTFPTNTLLKAGEIIVLANSEDANFEEKYGFKPFGYYEGKFSNSGEIVTLQTVTGEKIFNLEYSDKSPWPTAADGFGFTLVLIDANAKINDASNWTTSSTLGGTPGKDEIINKNTSIVINEIVADVDTLETEAIELYNQSDEAVNIGGWYLTDDIKSPKKWQIPSNTIIEANSTILFTEGVYDENGILDSTKGFSEKFNLSKHGEDIYLFGAKNNELTGYSQGYTYGETELNVSLGRVTTSTDNSYFVPLQEQSFGKINKTARTPLVAFEEIMYNPLGSDCEYVKITSNSTNSLNLSHWKITGIGFDENALQNFVLEPHASFYIIGVDAEIAENESSMNNLKKNFRTSKNIDTKTPIFYFTGSLSNSGECITIERAGEKYILKEDTIIPTYIEDIVEYNDKKPWPTSCDGLGAALSRIDLSGFGCEPTNWQASEVVKPIAKASNTPYRIAIHNSNVSLDGSGSYLLGNENAELKYSWKLITPAGSTATLDDSKSARPTFMCDVQDKYLAILTVSCKGVKSDADTVIIYEYNYYINNVSNIEENEQAQISVYPTISNGTIHFESNNTIEKIEINSPNGQKISTIEIGNTQGSFDIDTKGLYILKFIGKNLEKEQTVIIQ